MKIKRKMWLGLVAGLLLFPLRGEDPLEYWLADRAPFWSWDGATFMRQAGPLGFKWTQENQSAMASPLGTPIFGKPALEAVVRFRDGSPHSMMVSYFNRGDAKTPMSETEFQGLVRELIASISSTLHLQPRPGTNTSSRARVRDASRVWQRPNIHFELAYSYTPPSRGDPFRPEYIRLVAKKFTASDIPSHARDRVNPYEVRKHIVRDPAGGDVWIRGIPMVDQGPKGYCAAATSERILRFFGQEVDQHQIAQIANTTSNGGTSSSELKKALQAVGRQYGFALKSLLEWDFEDFREEMDDYNKAARKNGVRQIRLPGPGEVWYIAALYQAVDPETWKTFKAGQSADFRKFEQRVQQRINGGCPLAWSVNLGIFPEPGIQNGGGHLRLIIGYNTRTKELLFSDSWGSGHEKKRMPLDQAFAITTSLYSLEPKGLRL